jgi:hypothetical protein
VEELFRKTGSPLAVDTIKIISDGRNPDGTMGTPEHYAYEMTCKRIVAGISVGGQGGTMASEATYQKPWDYEYMICRLDDNGFIDLVWFAPLEVLDTEVEDSKLLPFSDIQAIFERMIFIATEADIQDGHKAMCEVTEVRLELMRVIKQNSNLEGLLVPVWNFYGTRLEYDENGKPNDFGYILFPINAIDGSIIDPGRGY